MILIAFPFNCEEIEKSKRIEYVKNLISEKLKQGTFYYSPILYAYDFLDLDVSTFYNNWKLFCKDCVKLSTKLVVIQFDGWEDSQGIKNEIASAIENNIEIEYLSPY